MARVDFRIPSEGVKVGKSLRLDSVGSDVGLISGDLFNQGNALKFHNGTSSKTVAFVDSTFTGTWNGATIAAGYGGTGISSYVAGDLIYATGTTTLGKLAKGTANQILGMNDGATAPEYKTINGTTNQVTVTNSTGAITFSLPQNIHTGAAPSFAGLTVTGTLNLNTGTLATNQTTVNIVNTTATTVNFAGAATTVIIGASTGTTTVNNNLTVSGNLTVNGSTTVVNSTTISVDDPIFTLGGDTAPTLDDNKDRGIEFRWHNGSAAKLGFFGYDDSTGKFTFIPDATNSSEVFSGTKGTIDVGGVETTTLTVGGLEIDPDATTPTGGQVLAYNGTKYVPTSIQQGTNTFGTISVAGQNDVVADSVTDILTLVAGTGVTITTNETTDTITFAIGQDVSTTSSPTFAALNVSDGTLSANEDFDSATLTSVTPTSIKSLATATYRSAKYVIQAVQGTNYMITEILAIHDGTSVTYTEYGTLTVGTSPASFDLDISSGSMRLLATSSSSSSTVYRVRTTAISV
jgi:hypothetical protein